MRSTGTAVAKPKGMGMVTSKLAKPDIVKDVPLQERLLEGTTPVRPRMQISKKPEAQMVRYGSGPTLEEAERLVDPSGYMARRLLTKEGSQHRLAQTLHLVDVLERTEDPEVKTAALMRLAELKKEAVLGAALRMGAAGLGTLARSKLFWGGAGVVGGGLALGKMFKGITGKVEDIRSKRDQKIPGGMATPWER
jgi:hypothetical protein